MSVAEIVGGQWAITRPVFELIQTRYEAHARGEAADLQAIEAALGRPLNNKPAAIQVQDGVAVISIEGPIAKRMGMLQAVSGGTSSGAAAAQLADALADPSVTAIVLAIDSPGGTVDGTEALADAVYAARGIKPIEAHIDGLGASAAYWIASAADAVYALNQTTRVGSIGVIAKHVDQSGADAAAGIKVTEVTSGALKSPTSSHAPLSDLGRETMQRSVDATHRVFAGAVQRNRKLSDSRIAAIADGRILPAGDAITAGLVDGFASLADRVKVLGTKSLAGRTHSTARTIMSPGDLVRASRLRQHQAFAAGIVPGFDVLSFISENGGR